MTLKTLEKSYKHLNELVKGKVKTGNPTKDQLIVSDAKSNLKDLLKKFPSLESRPVNFVPKKAPKPKESV